MSYEPIELIMVTEENNNKFYRLLPKDNGTFVVEYGRVGMPNFATMSYPISDWYKKYNEKVKKGYKDMSHLKRNLVIKTKNNDYMDIINQSIKTIVNRLQAMAKQAIAENYTISSAKVTQAMVDEAQVQINNLASAKTLDIFNRKLIDLFQTIPRKMGKVSDYVASDVSEISKIISREQDLLDIMNGQVIQNSFTEEDADEDGNIPDMTILDAMGLVFEEVDKTDIELIKKQLAESKDKFHQAWKVRRG